jgi:hypothetical protein
MVKFHGRFVATAICGIAALSAGCASIVSGRHAEVKLDSFPRNAQVSVFDAEGRSVAEGRTPTEVTLKRGRTWFRPAHYRAVFSAPGYQPKEVAIRGRANLWSAGNLAMITGAPIGLGVDAATGAMYQPKVAEECPHLSAGTPEQQFVQPTSGVNAGYESPRVSLWGPTPPGTTAPSESDDRGFSVAGSLSGNVERR